MLCGNGRRFPCSGKCEAVRVLFRDNGVYEMFEPKAKVKFCLEVEESTTETLNWLQRASGDETTSNTLRFERRAHFKGGRTSVQDDVPLGKRKPSKSVIPEIVKDHTQHW